MSDAFQVPGGPRIGVHTWGPPATPVVLLHGLGASGLHYASLADTLVGVGWQVHAVDFRGHGQSDHLPGTYTIVHYASDVEAFLESLDGPAAVVGHSLGGAVAVYLAGARPDLVLGAFAEDPPLYHGQPGVMRDSPFVATFEASRRAIEGVRASDDPVAAARAMLAARPSPTGVPWRETVSPESFEARVDSCIRLDPSVYDAAITGKALAGWDPERPVATPLVILRADSSLGPALTAEQAGRFRLANPHAEVIEIAGAPHGIREHLATAPRYVDELTRLLAQLR